MVSYYTTKIIHGLIQIQRDRAGLLNPLQIHVLNKKNHATNSTTVNK